MPNDTKPEWQIRQEKMQKLIAHFQRMAQMREDSVKFWDLMHRLGNNKQGRYVVGMILGTLKESGIRSKAIRILEAKPNPLPEYLWIHIPQDDPTWTFDDHIHGRFHEPYLTEYEAKEDADSDADLICKVRTAMRMALTCSPRGRLDLVPEDIVETKRQT